MKRNRFWAAMCLTSAVHGLMFYQASRGAMANGIPGADNQGALLFIPLLWLAAAVVLVLLNGYTLLLGRKIKREQQIGLNAVFHFANQKMGDKAGRAAFLAMTAVLMLFGYSLFASGLGGAYAVSGGLLLVLLYAWRNAAKQKVD